MEVEWTSIDALRMGIAEVWDDPVIVWIGVIHVSLSGADGVVEASKCRKLLVEPAATVIMSSSILRASTYYRRVPPIHTFLYNSLKLLFGKP